MDVKYALIQLNAHHVPLVIIFQELHALHAPPNVWLVVIQLPALLVPLDLSWTPETAVTVIAWLPIVKYAILHQTVFNAIKDSIFPQDHAFHARTKLKVVLFVTPAQFVLDASKDISYRVELVKYAAQVRAVDFVLDWEHVQHVIVDILSLEVDVFYVLLFFLIVSSVVILLFACNALADIISIMELVWAVGPVSINVSVAIIVPTALNAKVGTISTTQFVSPAL